MPRSIKKGPSVRSLTKQINSLLKINRELGARVYGAKKLEAKAVVHSGVIADNSMTGAVRAAEALGFKVHVTIGYKGGLDFIATKHERA